MKPIFISGRHVVWAAIFLLASMAAVVWAAYYTAGNEPVGGKLVNPITNDFRNGSDPVWKCCNQFVYRVNPPVTLTSELQATWTGAPWVDTDVYHPDCGPDEYPPDTSYLGTGFWWTDGSAAGSFADQSAAQPGYTIGAPAYSPDHSPESVTIQLWIRDDSNLFEFDDPDKYATGFESSDATWAWIQVFDSDLSRDIVNHGDLESHSTSDGANCGSAAHHAYNGTASDAVSCPWGGTGTPIYDINDPLKDTYGEIDFSVVKRGDCVTYHLQDGGGPCHVETFTTDEADATWGANTPSEEGCGNWSPSSVAAYGAQHPSVAQIKRYAKQP